MALTLTKRSVKGSALTIVEMDTNLSNIETEVNGKAASTHIHAISDVTGLAASLSSKIPNNEKGAVGGVAQLDGDGKLPAGQMTLHVHEISEINGLQEALDALAINYAEVIDQYNYAVDPSITHIKASSITSDQHINLPPVASCTRPITIMRWDNTTSGKFCKIQPDGSETIDGVLTIDMTNQYEQITLIPDSKQSGEWKRFK